VEQAGHDLLLRTRVAALADAGGLADAIAQVVELGAPDVAAGGDLDALDLRRVHGERPLDADAEGLLADGEGLAHPLALTLDDHALEDLRAATLTLDDLEVDADPVARTEGRHAAQLGALEAVDDGAHERRGGGGGAAWVRADGRRAAFDGSEERRGPPGPQLPPRSRERRRRHVRISSWWPESSTSGTFQPRYSAGGCSAGTPDCPPARR
jgi:hypothetical protein